MPRIQLTKKKIADGSMIKRFRLMGELQRLRRTPEVPLEMVADALGRTMPKSELKRLIAELTEYYEGRYGANLS